MLTKILKVCGLTEAHELQAVATLGADSLGVIFYPPSPRDVSRKQEFLAAVSRSHGARLCAVFVNHPTAELLELCHAYHFSTIQLAGDESPRACELLRASLQGTQIFKVIHISSKECLKKTQDYSAIVDRFLFESPPIKGLRGGTGQCFDWQLLEHYQGPRPFLVSGGIGPDTLEPVLRVVGKHPQFGGLDLNSKVELAPGKKDLNRVQQCISIFQSYRRGEPV